MKKKTLIACMLALLAFSSLALAEDLNKSVKSLDERLTELELSKALQRVTITGTMINRYENYVADVEANDSGSGAPALSNGKQRIQLPSTYLGLNFDVDVSERMKIYTTLAMTKMWNNQYHQGNAKGSWNASEAGSYNMNGDFAHFDRAYMTYSFKFPLSLSMGRMSTNMGPPLEQFDGLDRQGTYPRFAYNAIFDGVAAVYDFSHFLPENHSFKARAFYTPFTNVVDHDRSLQIQDSTDGTTLNYKVNSSTVQATALLEYQLKNLGMIASQFDLMYMFQVYRGFYLDGYPGHNPSQPANAKSPAGVAGATGFGLEDGHANVVYAGLTDTAHVGLNLSGSMIQNYWVDYDPSYNSTPGTSYLFNANQKVGIGLVGFEYIKTATTYYLDEWTTMNVIPFYSRPASHGYHIYASAPVAKRTILRVGFFNHETGIGPSFYDIDNKSKVIQSQKSQSIYAQLRVDF